MLKNIICINYCGAGAQPRRLISFAPLALILVVFYFLILRPQQKKFKAHQAMLAELKTGDKVILASGFTGKITKVGEKFFTVEIARNVEVEVERHAVAAKRTDA